MTLFSSILLDIQLEKKPLHRGTRHTWENVIKSTLLLLFKEGNEGQDCKKKFTFKGIV